MSGCNMGRKAQHLVGTAFLPFVRDCDAEPGKISRLAIFHILNHALLWNVSANGEKTSLFWSVHRDGHWFLFVTERPQAPCPIFTNAFVLFENIDLSRYVATCRVHFFRPPSIYPRPKLFSTWLKSTNINIFAAFTGRKRPAAR